MSSARRPPLHPSLRPHRMVANQRLSDVANMYRVPVRAIVAANPGRPLMRLGSGEVVFASLSEGEIIAIPGMVGARNPDQIAVGDGGHCSCKTEKTCSPSGGCAYFTTCSCTRGASNYSLRTPYVPGRSDAQNAQAAWALVQQGRAQRTDGGMVQGVPGTVGAGRNPNQVAVGNGGSCSCVCVEDICRDRNGPSLCCTNVCTCTGGGAGHTYSVTLPGTAPIAPALAARAAWALVQQGRAQRTA